MPAKKSKKSIKKSAKAEAPAPAPAPGHEAHALNQGLEKSHGPNQPERR